MTEREHHLPRRLRVRLQVTLTANMEPLIQAMDRAIKAIEAIGATFERSGHRNR